MSQKRTPGRARRWPGSLEQRQAGTASAPPRLQLAHLGTAEPAQRATGSHQRPPPASGDGDPQSWWREISCSRTSVLASPFPYRTNWLCTGPSCRQREASPMQNGDCARLSDSLRGVDRSAAWLRPNRTVSPAVYVYITALGGEHPQLPRVVRSRAGAGPPSPSSRSPAARSASARWPAGPAHSARP